MITECIKSVHTSHHNTSCCYLSAGYQFHPLAHMHIIQKLDGGYFLPNLLCSTVRKFTSFLVFTHNPVTYFIRHYKSVAAQRGYPMIHQLLHLYRIKEGSWSNKIFCCHPIVCLVFPSAIELLFFWSPAAMPGKPLIDTIMPLLPLSSNTIYIVGYS